MVRIGRFDQIVIDALEGRSGSQSPIEMAWPKWGGGSIGQPPDVTIIETNADNLNGHSVLCCVRPRRLPQIGCKECGRRIRVRRIRFFPLCSRYGNGEQGSSANGCHSEALPGAFVVFDFKERHIVKGFPDAQTTQEDSPARRSVGSLKHDPDAAVRVAWSRLCTHPTETVSLVCQVPFHGAKELSLGCAPFSILLERWGQDVEIRCRASPLRKLGGTQLHVGKQDRIVNHNAWLAWRGPTNFRRKCWKRTRSPRRAIVPNRRQQPIEEHLVIALANEAYALVMCWLERVGQGT